MKIFIDTNIFLDLVLKREYYKEALIILNAVEKNLFDATILDITLLNIDYVAKKQVKDIRNFLMAINSIVMVIGADNQTIKEALDMQNNGLEDNMQYIGAKNIKCDCIITNDKSFYSGDIPLCSSVEFVNRFINKAKK